MKTTALTQKHIALNAKMGAFAGYNMPISYSGIIDEHNTVRNAVGIFDVSHMGEFIIKGKNALELIQLVTSNDASKLYPGQAQYSCIPNKTGGIVDDVLIYHLEDENYMMVVNAANIQKDWSWIKAHNTHGAELVNISEKTGLLALQGPKAADVLAKITGVNVHGLSFYTFTKGKVAGVSNILISATGYTGSGGFEIYFKNDYATVIWDALIEAGEEFGLKPCGLAARDTLRLEMGYCLYGNDIDDNTSPIEAGLGWITKTNKKIDFNSKQIFAAEKKLGVAQKLVGLKIDSKRIPRKGCNIVNNTGEILGHVTSGTMSPNLEIPIAMGYISTPNSKEGTTVFVDIRGKQIPATVCKFPFVKI